MIDADSTKKALPKLFRTLAVSVVLASFSGSLCSAFSLENIERKTIHPERKEQCKKKYRFDFNTMENTAYHLKRFNEIVDTLPPEIRDASSMSVGHDAKGKLWSFTTDKGSWIWDSDNRRVFFKAPEENNVTISPNGRYILMEQRVEDATPDLEISILRASDGTTLVGKDKRFTMLDRFLCNDRYAYGRANNVWGYFDLRDPKTFVPMDKPLPNRTEFYEVPEKGVAYRSTENGTEILKIPTLEVTKNNCDIPVGHLCVSDDLNLIASYSGSVFFYSEITKGSIGLALSNTGEYLCELTMGEEDVIRFTGKRFEADRTGKILTGGHKDKEKIPVIEKMFSLKDGSEISLTKMSASKRAQLRRKYLYRRESAYSGISGVFADKNKLWVVFENENDNPQNRITLFVLVNNRLSIEKVLLSSGSMNRSTVSPTFDAYKHQFIVWTTEDQELVFTLK